MLHPVERTESIGAGVAAAGAGVVAYKYRDVVTSAVKRVIR